MNAGLPAPFDSPYGAANDPLPQSASNPQSTTHPILVGYDGSTASRHALDYATDMARNAGRPLLVAYVASMHPGYDMGFGHPAAPAAVDSSDLLTWLRGELAGAIELRSLDVDVVERTGDTARQLAALAVEHQADAVVVGAPEHRRHHLAGSVSAWLARHATCPVVIVP